MPKRKTSGAKHFLKKKPTKEAFLKEIADTAYGYFEKRGYTHGSDFEDWLRAEKEVKKKYGIK